MLEIDDSTTRLNSIRSLIGGLPKDNRQIFVFLLDFFRDLCTFSKENEGKKLYTSSHLSNQVTPEQLGKTFGPLLFRHDPNSQKTGTCNCWKNLYTLRRLLEEIGTLIRKQIIRL